MRHMVLRYTKLWLGFFRNSLTRDMEFKMNFIANLFIDFIYYGSLFFFFSVIFSYVDALGDFSRDAISQRVNADLSNNYGNLVQRITSFVVNNSNSIVFKTEDISKEDKNLINFLKEKFNEYLIYMNTQQIDKALKSVFELISETNSYTDKQAPWVLKKNNIKRMNVVLFMALNIIRNSSLMLMPVIPDSANKVLDILNIDQSERNFKYIKIIFKDIKIVNPKPIFPRIDSD